MVCKSAQHDPFIGGYFEALAFTNFGPDDGELEDKSVSDLSFELYQSSLEDCRAFQEKAGALLREAYERDYDEAQAGRDLWFTRCGHGVGYWDRKQLEPRGEWEALGSPRVDDSRWTEWIAIRDNSIGNRLSELAQGLGNIDLYLGDDGKVYGA
jgi:hypothetical protein